ncbi:hypothetical protein M5K25_005793 [Dendrobium thyrsiflorum]|uniref:Uncharacterized protein n=1 Tax=Dendrobium thyrsiflorum TaxID=117978 RepID=A0ABD0VIG6_DENTH
MARSFLSRAAQLVPVYRQFYIAANPNVAGNPLFYIHGGDVRCCGFDLADFYRREEICLLPAAAPAWTAKEPRRVEVWSELAGSGGGGGEESRLDKLMKEMGRRLRKGGWGEEEVREMLMTGGSNGYDEGMDGHRTVVKDLEGMMWHVRGLAQVMLRAGWSDQTIKIWNAERRKCIGLLTGHMGSVKSVSSHSSNPELFVSSSRDGSLTIWNLRCKFGSHGISRSWAISVVKEAHSSSHGRRTRRGQADSKSVAYVLYLKDDISIASAGAANNPFLPLICKPRSPCFFFSGSTNIPPV